MTILVREFPSKSDPGKKYHVTRTHEGGPLWCDCWPCKQKKTCGHIKTTEAEEQQFQPDPHRGPREQGGCVVVAMSPAPAITAEPTATSTGFIKPQLASVMKPGLTIESFANDAYCQQEKKDGDRVLVRKVGSKVTAWSRNAAGKECNGRPVGTTFPADIAAAFLEVPDGVYDGELMLPGTTSKMDSVRGFFAFDILELLGDDLTKQPFIDRHGYLVLAVAHHEVARTGTDGELTASILISVPKLEAVSREGVERIWAAGGEGAILKRKASIYQPGYRTADWVKVKKLAADIVTITGFEEGKLGPHAVTLVQRDNGLTAKVPTKDGATRRDIDKKPSAYIGRRLVIYYTELTEHGNYRHAGWDHLQES
jgi:hypothetical protein